jgi:hypothetical protein
MENKVKMRGESYDKENALLWISKTDGIYGTRYYGYTINLF